MAFRIIASMIKSTLAVSAVFFMTAAVQAAPQALGLVATNEPVPLTCDGHDCSGYFTSFCLQMARTQPKPQTPYQPAEATDLVLHVTNSQGETFDLPGGKFLKFSARTSTGVDISVNTTLLKAYSPQSVAVSVPQLSSLVPIPVKGDLFPQEPNELAKSLTEHRKIAIGYHEQGHRHELAALTAMLINAMPKGYGVSAGDREQIWNKITSRDIARSFTPSAVTEVRESYERCGRNADNSTRRTMRGCLEIHHIYLQLYTNKDFWTALEGV